MARLPEPALVFLIGASGSGKSTWAAERYLGHEIVSSDTLRAMVGTGESDMEASGEAFSLLRRIVEVRTRRRLTTVVDTTGLDAELRAWCLNRAGEAAVPAVAVIFDTPEPLCRARNRERPRPVPAGVLGSQLARMRRVVDEVAGEPWVEVLVISDHPEPVTTAERVEVAARRPVGLSFVLHISRFDWPANEMGDRLAAIARSAEEAGFAGVSFMDHLVQIPQVGRPWENIPEIFIAMSHVAAHSSRLEVGPLVLNMTLRNPAVVAKAVATLDVLSAGRAFCGVGAGWNESEEVGYGFPRRTTSERMEMLEEGVQVMRSMWAPGPSSFSGSTIVLDGAVAYPRPVRGHVPIVVGGGGERRTLRIAAEHADAINVLGGPEVIARKRAVLAEHCLDVGRDPSEIATTVLDVALVGENRGHVADLVDRYRGRAGAQAYVRRVNAGTVADQVERYAALGEIGTDRVFVALVDLDGPGPVERFGGVIAALDAAVG